MQFAKFLADMLQRSGNTPTSREEGQKALSALAQELAKAGYPASAAQKTITETATQGSIKAGYGPNSAANIFGSVTRAINEMVGTAMQGYHAGKMPETQGPPAPVAPGRQGALPFGQQFAEAPGSLFDMLSGALSQLNPISTAEARGARGPSRDEVAAIQLARQGGSMGGQPGRSVVGDKIFTFYAPGASGAKGTEGPNVGSKGNPLFGLDDVRGGRSDVVSLAGHPSQFGPNGIYRKHYLYEPIDGQNPYSK
jgi:hypothetical protein